MPTKMNRQFCVARSSDGERHYVIDLDSAEECGDANGRGDPDRVEVSVVLGCDTEALAITVANGHEKEARAKKEAASGGGT